ncbi:c-type cytochrome [Lichenicoccus sp.]|uniref:c-type cytochrome n=1 Tax=Lichenicoccus sp. TaxID=2781899 RepID=UPI003D130893
MRRTFAVSALLIAAATGARAETAATLYSANCAACHRADAAGVAGQYPPLKGRIDKIAVTAEGRRYLADVLLYGMVGQIEANGAAYVGYMPAFNRLSDADIASVLTWISSLGGSKPPPAISAADVTAARAQPLTAAGVAKQRQALEAAHPLP